MFALLPGQIAVMEAQPWLEGHTIQLITSQAITVDWRDKNGRTVRMFTAAGPTIQNFTPIWPRGCDMVITCGGGAAANVTVAVDGYSSEVPK